jgi:hypothetical protein
MTFSYLDGVKRVERATSVNRSHGKEHVMSKYQEFHRVAALAGVLLALTVGILAGPAAAEVPSSTPTFSDPLNITNTYQPFPIGAVKLYAVQQGHTDAEVMDLYLEETRTFEWNGSDVECRILQEVEYEDGELAEISSNYFAQADDGAMYYFGEVVDIYEEGEIVSHEGSWLVSGPTLPSDPAETATATDPTVFMPANPEVGDQFKPEDLFPLVDETAEVMKVGKTVSVQAGVFKDCIRILESSRLSEDTETKWYAPGVGVVRVKEKGEILVLVEIILDD